MRSCRCEIVLASSLLLAGCASVQLDPITISHPAHPGAPAASAPPRSTTLAYSPSDVPSARPLSARGRAVHHGSATPDAATARTVVGRGEVIATVPTASQVVLEHGEIAGFMEPMTMGYRVDPPSLLDGVKPGDSVRFTIDVEQRAIIAIEKAP